VAYIEEYAIRQVPEWNRMNFLAPSPNRGDAGAGFLWNASGHIAFALIGSPKEKIMTSFKRAAGVAAVAAVLTSSFAYAEAPLPAGKPAGTKQAELLAFPLFWVGLAVIGLGIGLAVSGGDDNTTTPTTSTSGTGG
jgi:hypothetical protein